MTQKSSTKKQIIVTGWGTGWHVFPVKTILENLEKKGVFWVDIDKVFRLWLDNSLEQKVCDDIKNDNIVFVSIMSWKWRREGWFINFIKNVKDLFALSRGVVQSVVFLCQHPHIKLIFCKWWFVSLPAVLAWRFFRVPIVMHESDVVPGLANRICARFATTIFTGFDDVLPGAIPVWQILSEQLLAGDSTIRNQEDLAFKGTKMLLVWGAQGAQAIYETVANLLDTEPWLQKIRFYVILGTKNMALQERFLKHSNVRTFDFVSQEAMGELCRACDVWVTRGGVTSLAEQKLFEMKLAIVPHPTTWGNHQYHNALNYSKRYGDEVILQNGQLQKHLLEFLVRNIDYRKTLHTSDLKESLSYASYHITEKILNILSH